MINLILMRELKKLMCKYSMQFCTFFLFKDIELYSDKNTDKKLCKADHL